MKFRTDFVTNSSSSCFVVETGENMGEVKKALQKILKGYGIMLDSPTLPYNDIFHGPYVYTKEAFVEHEAEVKKWKEERKNERSSAWDWDGWRYESKDNIGKVLIMSASDNTVPWDICEIIERRFKTRREHLG